MAKTTTERSRDLYRRRRGAGLCVRCGEPPEKEGASKCNACAGKSKGVDAARREEVRAAGICARCKKEPVAPGKKMCSPCADKNRTRVREEVHARREQGLCSQCCEPALPGKSRCAFHEQASNAASTKRTERLRAEGLCVQCGVVPHDKPGVCPSCHSKNYAKVKEGRQEGQCWFCSNPAQEGGTLCVECSKSRDKRRAARDADGICRDCSNPVVPGRKRCEKHLKADKERIKKRQQKKRDMGLCARCGLVETTSHYCDNCGAKPRRYLGDLLEKQDDRCSGCGRSFCKSRKPQVDHLIPANLGGGSSEENCCNALCQKCNALKRDRVMTMGELREENAKLGRLPKNPVFPEAQGDEIVAAFHRKQKKAA